MLYEYPNSYSHLDIKDILIPRSIRSFFFLFTISVKIENINLIKDLKQTMAHSSKRWIIQITVISDKSNNTIACPLNTPLSKTNKFDVIIAQPLCLCGLF